VIRVRTAGNIDILEAGRISPDQHSYGRRAHESLIWTQRGRGSSVDSVHGRRRQRLLDPRQDFSSGCGYREAGIASSCDAYQSAVVGRGTAEDGTGERHDRAVGHQDRVAIGESRSPCAGCARCAPGRNYWSSGSQSPSAMALFRFITSPAGEVSQDVLKTESIARCRNRRCSDESVRLTPTRARSSTMMTDTRCRSSSSMRIGEPASASGSRGKEESPSGGPDDLFKGGSASMTQPGLRVGGRKPEGQRYNRQPHTKRIRRRSPGASRHRGSETQTALAGSSRSGCTACHCTMRRGLMSRACLYSLSFPPSGRRTQRIFSTSRPPMSRMPCATGFTKFIGPRDKKSGRPGSICRRGHRINYYEANKPAYLDFEIVQHHLPDTSPRAKAINQVQDVRDAPGFTDTPAWCRRQQLGRSRMGSGFGTWIRVSPGDSFRTK